MGSNLPGITDVHKVVREVDAAGREKSQARIFFLLIVFTFRQHEALPEGSIRFVQMTEVCICSPSRYMYKMNGASFRGQPLYRWGTHVRLPLAARDCVALSIPIIMWNTLEKPRKVHFHWRSLFLFWTYCAAFLFFWMMITLTTVFLKDTHLMPSNGISGVYMPS